MAKKRRLTATFGTGVDQFFSAAMPLFALSGRIWNPPTDVFESGDHVIIRMELAGLDEEVMDVTASGRRLIVRGRRREPTGDGVVCYHLMEVQYGGFERIFEFPYTLKTEDINASYDKGFLCIKLPKKTKKTLEITIEVIAAGAREA